MQVHLILTHLQLQQMVQKKSMASTADLTVSVERAANTLVYTDGTQGWLLNK